MVPVPVRPWASAMEIGSVLVPGVVAAGTIVAKEKLLSPAVASPLVPSSKNCCIVEPPMLLKSPDTVTPVLVGFAPGLTSTVSNVVPPAATDEGVAAPAPLGFVVPTG